MTEQVPDFEVEMYLQMGNVGQPLAPSNLSEIDPPVAIVKAYAVFSPGIGWTSTIALSSALRQSDKISVEQAGFELLAGLIASEDWPSDPGLAQANTEWFNRARLMRVLNILRTHGRNIVMRSDGKEMPASIMISRIAVRLAEMVSDRRWE